MVAPYHRQSGSIMRLEGIAEPSVSTAPTMILDSGPPASRVVEGRG